METPLPHRHPGQAIAMRDRLVRMEEPWFLNQAIGTIGGLALAVFMGWLIATGQFETLILCAVWIAAVSVIVFVRDYWWSPALIVTALSIRTHAAGFMLTGLEVGMLVIALTFPVKLAMKQLWPVKPKLDPGIFYWALLGFLALHCIIIYFYSKIDGAQQIKNIFKAYYGALAPLVLFGMLMRYCRPQTVYRTFSLLFGIWLCTGAIAIAILALGVQVPPLSNLRIQVDFLEGGIGFLRQTGPYLFATALAFWPVAKTGGRRFLLFITGILGIVGTLFSAGRTAVFYCLFAGLFFACVRRRLWMALPVLAAAALAAGIMTADPELLEHLPVEAQRALAPMNFSDQKTDIQQTLSGSDRWHQELRTGSLIYWTADTNSLFFGHGFKSWDDSLVMAETDVDTLKRFAIEMGMTENMFSAVTNIFGLAGLVLYSAFLIHLAWRLWQGRQLSPHRSNERAICEFSLVNLLTALILAPFLGGVPGISLIVWQLGVLAARPYLGKPEEKEPATPRPSFDRSRETPRPMPARANRRARGRFVPHGLQGL